MKKFLLFAVISFFISCKKENDASPLPVIEIYSPNNNQHFIKGETIHVSGTITHKIALTEVGVHMTDQTTKIEFFHNHFSAGNTKTFNYDANYVIPDNTKSTFKVEVEATDADGNSITKEITVTTN
jgi:Domain of unknown function (DUF4625)